jgi:hypothetical protein
MRDSQFREELGKNRQTDESRAFVGSKVVDVAEEMTGALFFISIPLGQFNTHHESGRFVSPVQ